MERAFTGERGVAVRLSRVENYDDLTPAALTGSVPGSPSCAGATSSARFALSRSPAEGAKPLSGEHRCRSQRPRRAGTQGNHASRSERKLIPGRSLRLRRPDEKRRCSGPLNEDTLHDVTSAGHVGTADRSYCEEVNICKYVHLPVQSGSDRILGLMNRTYSVDHYRRLMHRIRKAIPGVAISTDIISGFLQNQCQTTV